MIITMLEGVSRPGRIAGRVRGRSEGSNTPKLLLQSVVSPYLKKSYAHIGRINMEPLEPSFRFARRVYRNGRLTGNQVPVVP